MQYLTNLNCRNYSIYLHKNMFFVIWDILAIMYDKYTKLMAKN